MTSTLRNRRRAAQAAQAGLTLVELMVGLAVGMLFAAGLITMFATASSNGANLQRASAQIENGRYVAEMLRDDLQLAGFYGPMAVEAAIWTTPDPCATTPGGFDGTTMELPTAVRGYGTAEALGCLSNRQPGTDAMVVRRLDTATVLPTALPAGNARYHVQVSQCDLDPGSVQLVFDKAPTAFTLRSRGCTDPNAVRAYVSRIYFVARCNRCGTGGDSIPTLKRLDLGASGLEETALVEGVETMRLEYGFDTDADGDVDAWRLDADASGAASEWQNVVALRLHYLLRSTDRVSGDALAGPQRFDLGAAGSIDTTADGFVRRAYSTTVRLVNVSGPREQQ